jgi:hypothetical protein
MGLFDVSDENFRSAAGLLIDPILAAFEDVKFVKAIREHAVKEEYEHHKDVIEKILFQQPGIHLNDLYDLLVDRRAPDGEKMFRSEEWLLRFTAEGQELGNWSYEDDGYRL